MDFTANLEELRARIDQLSQRMISRFKDRSEFRLNEAIVIDVCSK